MKNSEILQDIYLKISSIESLLKLNDYQQKLIIKKLNDLNLEKKEPDLPPVPGKAIAPDPTPEVAHEEAVTKKNKLMNIKRTKDEGGASYSSYEFEKELAEVKEENTNSNELNSNRNFPVIQKLSGKTGKVISSASVVVKNSDGEVVKQTNTNSSGRWMAMLPIGRYVAEVSGKDGKETISYAQSFEVMASSSLPILLPMPEMYKRYVEE